MNLAPPFSNLDNPHKHAIRQTQRPVDGLFDPNDKRANKLIGRVVDLAKQRNTNIREVSIRVLEAGVEALEKNWTD